MMVVVVMSMAVLLIVLHVEGTFGEVVNLLDLQHRDRSIYIERE